MTDHRADTGLKQDVKRLHSDGMGRNAIARELGMSTRQVDNAARAAGITFPAATTAAATRARVITAQAERQEIAADIRRAARTVLDRLLESEALPLADVKELTWALGSLVASDSRYARLDLDAAFRGVIDHDDADNTADTITELLDTLRSNARPPG